MKLRDIIESVELCNISILSADDENDEYNEKIRHLKPNQITDVGREEFKEILDADVIKFDGNAIVIAGFDSVDCLCFVYAASGRIVAGSVGKSDAWFIFDEVGA